MNFLKLKCLILMACAAALVRSIASGEQNLSPAGFSDIRNGKTELIYINPKNQSSYFIYYAQTFIELRRFYFPEAQDCFNKILNLDIFPEDLVLAKVLAYAHCFKGKGNPRFVLNFVEGLKRDKHNPKSRELLKRFRQDEEFIFVYFFASLCDGETFDDARKHEGLFTSYFQNKLGIKHMNSKLISELKSSLDKTFVEYFNFLMEEYGEEILCRKLAYFIEWHANILWNPDAAGEMKNTINVALELKRDEGFLFRYIKGIQASHADEKRINSAFQEAFVSL